MQPATQIEQQKGNNRYLIAKRSGTLYRTRYNIHNNFTTVTHVTAKGEYNIHHLHEEIRHVMCAHRIKKERRLQENPSTLQYIIDLQFTFK
jgi:hypothetical protein